MHIGELFHVVHVVDDLSAAESWYERVFAPRYMFRRHYSPLEERDASMMIFCDFIIEPMTTREDPEQAKKPVGRFRARFGQRLHSIAYYTHDVSEALEELQAHGIRLTGDGGAALDGSRSAIYTHPRDTFGLLEFMEPRIGGRGGIPVGDVLGECYDPRLKGEHSTDYWRLEHPLGIQRTDRMMILVRDLPRARKLFVNVLGGALFHEASRTEYDTHSLFVAVGSETVIELARPRSDDSHLARELERNGEMLYSVTFRVRALNRAERHLQECGLRPSRRDGLLVVDPAEAFGAVYGFTDTDLPGDPRPAPSERME
jgi:catechol 2,3-dioxygenase-like lactoylglutathione lyase family enzyme